MKLIGIVGSTAEVSTNRKLLSFIKKQFTELFTLELVEIKDLPLFNQDDDQTNSPEIQQLNRKIILADGVIIATPEHNHTVPAGLKSVLEWLSFKIHPLENKPVMVVGASYYDQGTSRSQLHLRQILDAPGVNALVMPGNEFLLGKSKEAFDEDGNLIDQRTIDFLGSTLASFVKFINVVSALAGPKQLPPEDLHATGKIATTVEGVDMSDDQWLEKAAEAVGAVSGNTYVQLNRGLLTVDQINYFLDSMPMELTFADSNNQFLYYNLRQEAHEMLAARVPGQVGNPLANCHPEKSYKNVEWVIQQLRSGATDAVRVHVPKQVPEKYIVHNYQAMHDENGEYAGINEYILDFKPIIEWYLQQTGQKLVGNEDAVSSASVHENSDAVTSASVHEDKAEPATTTGAPEAVAVDAVSSASVK
ncbi:NAD(P)H-dependent oxidoreductase [Enterococcus gallinarum]|uniref:NAD(P)H-dependent oxidoreductase n=1 Tax=Enterococcus gallinarum TaxID=1353 RepID=UPI0012E22D47|nr:NAD(P)H-dependent oxidoreductase [Enterococcus gallinarum]MUO32208.1 NADPH-dependent oxidoreductase [Enterococcus gallinarum]